MTEPTERDRMMVIALFQSPEGATVGRVAAAIAAAREEGRREERERGAHANPIAYSHSESVG